jgi:chaperonin cofactor prefoldin
MGTTCVLAPLAYAIPLVLASIQTGQLIVQYKANEACLDQLEMEMASNEYATTILREQTKAHHEKLNELDQWLKRD